MCNAPKNTQGFEIIKKEIGKEVEDVAEAEVLS